MIRAWALRTGLALVHWATAPARRALEDRRAAVKRELEREMLATCLRIADLEALRVLPGDADHVSQHALAVQHIERLRVVHEALG